MIILGIFLWSLLHMVSISYANNFPVKKEILQNGIVLLHNYNNIQPLVSTIIFLKMGSIYEPFEYSGISELLQNTILKGTKTRTAQQIAEEIESIGGGMSAESGDDFSTLSVSVRNEYFEKSIEILYDVFSNPTFPEKELEKEKMNLIAGILARKDSIFNVAIDELTLNMYGKKHPYGRNPYKSIKRIKKFTREDVVKWWDRFYGVDEKNKNIIVVISGDIDFEKAKKVVEEKFSNIKKINLPSFENWNYKKKSKHVKRKVHFKQSYLMYGFYAPPISTENLKKYLGLKLITLYLGGGMSGKLFEILREEKSLCYETNNFYPTKLLGSHFVIYLGLDKNNLEVAKKEIEKILNQLKTEGFTEEELLECKTKLKGRFLLDHQTNAKQAWYLGFWEVLGLGYEYDKKYIEEIENIKIEDIKETIKELTSSPRVIVELISR